MNSETANPEVLGSHQKAFRINMDVGHYGTFAEIGAGQEVARTFFRAGGAAGTVAKTMSAYDMTFSDAIYGPCERYVSRQRLHTMLDYEYGLLLERLNKSRSSNTRFFVFADTVAARSYSRQHDAHGWMGVKFQTQPQSPPSQILLHVRMYDKENVPQQEALGTVGVNLLYGAFYKSEQPKQLISSLMDHLDPQRVEVDLVKFSGPAFAHLDDRLMNLQLVHHGLTNAILFTPAGEAAQPADVLYNKAILIERGSFRPVNWLNLDMLKCARDQFARESQAPNQEIAEIMEITTRNLMSPGSGVIDHEDFLARVDLLGALDKNVMISRLSRFYSLAAHLSGFTKNKIGFALGIPTLKEIFDEKYYTDLDGGILESFGRLFKNAVKLYIHPFQAGAGPLITAQNLEVAPRVQHLYAHLLENRYLEFLQNYNERHLPIRSQIVLDHIQSGNHDWENMVPPTVARLIKEHRFFGFQ